MITLRTTTDLLLQIPRTHVAEPLSAGPLPIYFRGFDEQVITLAATVQALTNCYLLTIADASALGQLSLNAQLELRQGQVVVYRHAVQLSFNLTA